jgi:hypothetical protein
MPCCADSDTCCVLAALMPVLRSISAKLRPQVPMFAWQLASIIIYDPTIVALFANSMLSWWLTILGGLQLFLQSRSAVGWQHPGSCLSWFVLAPHVVTCASIFTRAAQGKCGGPSSCSSTTPAESWYIVVVLWWHDWSASSRPVINMQSILLHD